MIKINLQTLENLARNKAVANAVNQIRNRSFGDRHPELGKMINCAVCGERHRGAQCTPIYSKYPEGHPEEGEDRIVPQTTVKAIYGAHTVAKRRFHPHPNKRSLQLVQRTQQLYPLNSPYISDPIECMKESRKQAQRQLKTERALEAKIRRDAAHVSRHTNRVSQKSTTVFRRYRGTPAGPTVRNERLKRQAETTKANVEAKNGGLV